MSFVKYPPTNLAEAIDVIEQDSQILHEVVHGLDDQEVLTENGNIPSVAKALRDILNRTPFSVFEEKLYSELVGGLFELTTIEYTLQTEVAGRLPVYVFVDGVLTTNYEQVSSTSIRLLDAGISPTAKITVATHDLGAFSGGGSGAVLGVTLEEFDPEAGTGGDDTDAFEAACAASLIRKLPVQLLAKTYRLRASVDGGVNYFRQAYAIQGVGAGSILQFINDGVTDAGDNFFDFQIEDYGWLKDFVYDGNISDDPEAWDSSNFNTWTGGRGYRLLSSNHISIDNVHVRNVVNPGHGIYNCNHVSLRNCTTVRARGRFGDGFISAEGTHHTYENCYAYDYTRIGFVADKTTGESVSQLQYTNCVAMFGHDQANLYGIEEYNAGYWIEFGVNATYTRCYAYDNTDSGFRCPIGTFVRYGINNQDAFSVSLIDCVAGKSTYAITAGSLTQIDTQFHIENFIGFDVGIGLFLAEDRTNLTPAKLTKYYVNNCKLFIDNSGAGTTRAILPLGGDVELNNVEVYYKVTPNWDTLASNRNEGTAVISWFGSGADRPRKLKVNNIRTWGGADKVEIPTRIYLGFTEKDFEFILENSRNIYMDEVWCSRFVSNNVEYVKLGSTFATKSVSFNGGQINGIFTLNTPNPSVTVGVYNTTEYINFDNVDFNLGNAITQKLYIANITNTSTKVKVRLNHCSFNKNVTTHGEMILIGADNAVITTPDVHNIMVSNCLFQNTSTSNSTNPIIKSLVEANVAVFGQGNYKSATLTVDAGPNTTNSGAINYVAANF